MQNAGDREAAQCVVGDDADLHEIVGPCLGGREAFLEEMPAAVAGVHLVDRDDLFQIGDGDRARAMAALGVIMIPHACFGHISRKGGFGFSASIISSSIGSSAISSFWACGHQALAQFLAELAKFVPARVIEALRAASPIELDERGAERPDDVVLVGQMRADGQRRQPRAR